MANDILTPTTKKSEVFNLSPPQPLRQDTLIKNLIEPEHIPLLNIDDWVGANNIDEIRSSLHTDSSFSREEKNKLGEKNVVIKEESKDERDSSSSSMNSDENSEDYEKRKREQAIELKKTTT